jgi:short-subunit dehydrogenase
MARPIALITGASSGIGAALAREVANDGYDVVLSARRVEPMQALAGELESYGASATILAADLSKSGNAPDLVREIDQHGMAVDLLINNAGLGDNGALQNPIPRGSARCFR